MTAELKKSELKSALIGSAILVLLGVLALCIGIRFLVLLVPAAVLVWYLSTRPVLPLGSLRRLRSTFRASRPVDLRWENRPMSIRLGTKPVEQRAH
jgi:hypothetical protein